MMTSRARFEADSTLWIGRSCRPNSSAPASARSLSGDKELTERLAPAIRQDTRDFDGPQPSATMIKVSPAKLAHHSTYISQRSLVVERGAGVERSQHICFPIRISTFGNSANTISVVWPSFPFYRLPSSVF